jgi:hypothetical protein
MNGANKEVLVLGRILAQISILVGSFVIYEENDVL